MAFTHATGGNSAVFKSLEPRNLSKTLGFPSSAHAEFSFAGFSSGAGFLRRRQLCQGLRWTELFIAFLDTWQ